jgi:hypothetical protein
MLIQGKNGIRTDEEVLAVPDRHHRPSRRGRQRGAVVLRCGEKSSRQKTGLDVGMVKSAVADPADVLAAYVSKMCNKHGILSL